MWQPHLQDGSGVACKSLPFGQLKGRHSGKIITAAFFPLHIPHVPWGQPGRSGPWFFSTRLSTHFSFGSLDRVEGALPKFHTTGGRSCCRMKSLKPDWTTCFKPTNQPTSQTNKTLNAYYHCHAGISAIHSVKPLTDSQQWRVPITKKQGRKWSGESRHLCMVSWGHELCLTWGTLWGEDPLVNTWLGCYSKALRD